MSDKKKGDEEGLQIDVTTFEREIDKEIDSLFISEGASAAWRQEDGEGTQFDVEPAKMGIEAQVDALFNAEKNALDGAQTGGGGFEVDATSFEKEIAREIDSLFAPEGAGSSSQAVLDELEIEAAKLFVESQMGEESADFSDAGFEASTMNEEMGGDLPTFENQIDKEIDALFIPVGPTPVLQVESSPEKIEEEKLPEEEIIPATLRTGSPAPFETPTVESSLGDEFGKYESEVDREIDSLFVPLAQPTLEPQGPGHAKASGPQTAFGKKDKAPGAQPGGFSLRESTPPGRSPAVPAAKPAAKPAATPIAASPGVSPAPAGAGAAPAEGSRVSPGGKSPALSALLETFSIAYLSLEWDFSPENISKFDTALGALSSYSERDVSTQTVYKILKSAMYRFQTMPASTIDAELSELVHDGQDMLRTFLLSGDAPRMQEKERLRSLVKRFQTIREKALAAKGVVGVKAAVEVSPPSKAGAEAPSAAPGLPQIEIPDLKEAGDIREWILSFRSKTGEAVEGLSGETKRLLQIEGILSRTPALAPLQAHLAKIRQNLLDYSVSLSQNDAEWERRLEWLGNLENLGKGLGSSPGAQPAIEPVPAPFAAAEPAPTEGQEVAPAPAAAPAAAPKPSAAPMERRRDDVFVFTVSGRRLAVLASQVVKVEKVSKGALQKFMKRGHSTLLDFKPFFRSVKTGVFGTWSGMPDNVLKKYQFAFLPPDLLGVETVPSSGGVVLVSNGRSHGMIVSDSPEVNLHNNARILIAVDRPEGVLGVIEQEGGDPLTILNLDTMLKKL